MTARRSGTYFCYFWVIVGQVMQGSTGKNNRIYWAFGSGNALGTEFGDED